MTTTSATSSSSATASLISSLGGGSGIDMSGLAEQLSAAQFATRIDQIASKSDKLTTQISAVSTLKGMISTIASSLGQRVRTGDLAATPTIANSAVATVSKGLLTGSGTSTLEVTSLARGQTLTSPLVSPSTAGVGSGTLTLRFGTVNGQSFTEGTTQQAVTLTIPPGARLADVATAINRSGAGVSAYVADGANGAQLVLRGKDGAANGFILEASENADEPGLSALAWNPAGDATRLKAAASDAAYILDGVSRTSTSNTIADAAPGLSLKLTGTNAGAPTTIGFSDPSAGISTAMDDLTSALNEMIAELNKDTDPNSGTLSNDPGARALRRALNGLTSVKIMPNAAPGAPTTLSDLGVKTNRDGTFTFDSDRLAQTIKRDPAGTSAMFTNGLFGVFATIDGLSRKVTSVTDANALGSSLTRMNSLQASLAKKKTDLQTKQEDLRQQLVSRFSKLNSQLTASKSTQSFLTAQIDAWNGKNN